MIYDFFVDSEIISIRFHVVSRNAFLAKCVLVSVVPEYRDP